MGDEFARAREGNRREVGGRVALNESSTSFSGGLAGREGVSSTVDAAGGLTSDEAFLDDSRCLLVA